MHEGIPGHYFQLCLSWKHEDPIRRHYYDSGANEGIGFYAEEMMLQAGLFDDSPHTREIIYNFMRLRALRVEVDVKLALGEFTLEQAAKYLEEKVPMDAKTARSEAIAFSTGPGPGAHLPDRANFRSQNFSPKRASKKATNSISAPSTISFGKTGMSRSRCSAWNIWRK